MLYMIAISCWFLLVSFTLLLKLILFRWATRLPLWYFPVQLHCRSWHGNSERASCWYYPCSHWLNWAMDMESCAWRKFSWRCQFTNVGSYPLHSPSYIAGKQIPSVSSLWKDVGDTVISYISLTDDRGRSYYFVGWFVYVSNQIRIWRAPLVSCFSTDPTTP